MKLDQNYTTISGWFLNIYFYFQKSKLGKKLLEYECYSVTFK